ncbi:DUF6445 family protein [Sphingomonas sp. 8AM]|uniref:DUF6445 family protein n=1 Tax=Sphingomonas sp. 8AM TaxID=2653170 RepID=UPI0012F02750|nr:DUF6445 family protein [Sphingomonas sp. 8AM]VXC36284.1 conserved hypothetical protein [Sphingomonas sp. 8AM]
MTIGHDLAFAPGATLTVLHVGAEREPVLVIDCATGQVDALRAFAAGQAAFAPAASVGSGYPGLLGTAPVAYIDAMVRGILPLIATHFTGHPVRPARARGNFSLVTTAPDALTAEQRVPHVDTADRLQFATVHFLSPGNRDGTAFFRHRATGFETLDAARLPTYQAARADDPAPPSRYCTGADDGFEAIEIVPALPDRLILYRAALLHSGWITTLPAQAADPRHGRLTGNLFLQCRGAP